MVNKKFLFILIFLLGGCYPFREVEKEPAIVDSIIDEVVTDSTPIQIRSNRKIEFDTNISIPPKITAADQELFDQLLEMITSSDSHERQAITKYAKENDLDDEFLWEKWIELRERVQFETHGNYPTMPSDLINITEEIIAENIENEDYYLENVVSAFDFEDSVVQAGGQVIIEDDVYDMAVRFKLNADYKKATLLDLIIGEQVIVSADESK